MRMLWTTLSLWTCLGPCAALAQCLPHTGTKELRGTLIARTFPGPPNYESIKNGDRPEKYWLLKLGSPICVAQGPNETDAGAMDVKEIQLLLRSDDYSKYRHLLGKHVQVSGSFMSAITGHHKTPVLLEKVSITESK